MAEKTRYERLKKIAVRARAARERKDVETYDRALIALELIAVLAAEMQEACPEE